MSENIITERACYGGEIVFVDSRVEDYQTLLHGLSADVQVVVLDPGCDGLAQIADALAGRRGVADVHVISHGGPGLLQLGSSRIGLDDLGRPEWAALRDALSPEADLLLYGCEVAAGAEGRAFLAGLADRTGADVAASNDLTGAASNGGDWDLEVATGEIEARVALGVEAQATYAYTLPVADENFEDDTTFGIVSNDFVLDGIRYQFTTNSAFTYASSVVPEGSSGALSSHGLSLNVYAEPGLSAVTISAQDGAAFRLMGLKLFVWSEAVFTLTTSTGGSISFLPDGGPYTVNLSGNANFHSITSFTISGSLHFVDLDDLDFAPPNTAPSIAGAGSTPTITDKAAATPFSGLSFTDAEGDGGSIGITYTSANGSLSGAGLTGSAGSYTLSGASSAELTSRLQALVFTPAANQIAPGGTVQTAFVLTPRDANLMYGLSHSATTVTVQSVNDVAAATNLTLTASYTEDPGSAVALDNIVVTDPDTGETITATLTLSDPAAGTLSTGTFGAATSTFAAGVWTVTGSVANVNAALAAVAFTPAANWDQDVTIATRIRDAANTGPADGVITLDVTPVADVPTVTAPPALSTTEDTPRTLTAADFNFADGDGDALASVTITSLPAAGTLTLDGAAVAAGAPILKADIDAGRLVFTPAANASGTGYATFAYTVSDGTLSSAPATATIDVAAVNDAPSATPGLGYLNAGAALETGAVVAITAAELHEGDPDDAGAGVTYTVTAAPMGGALFLDADGDGVVDGGEALAVSSTFTQADIDAGRLKYRHAGGPGTSDAFTFSVADGGENGAAPLTGQTFSISVTERPVIAIGAGAPSFAEDGTAAAIAPGLTIADGDSAAMAGATVRVTDFVAGDLLSFANQNGIVGSYDGATGVLTLAGVATRGQYEAALRSVGYSSSSNNPATGAGNADRVIRFEVSDGVLTSASADATVTVANANDAPVLDASQSPALAGVAEDSAGPANGSTAGSVLVSTLMGGVSDVDTGAVAGVAVTGVGASGTLWYSTDNGTTWVQAPAVSPTSALLLGGSARLYFQPNANVFGTISDAITIRAWDRTTGVEGGMATVSAHGGGSAFSAAVDTVSIAIAGSNDAPTGAVSVSGAAEVGATLAAGHTLVDPDGLGAVTYQWRSDGADIPGAQAATLSVTADMLGKAISVVARYVDGGGTTETRSSAATAAVTNPPPPPEPPPPSTPEPTSGDDLVVLGDQPQAFSAGQGDDAVTGGASGDFLHGNVGDDRLFGGGGDDVMHGGRDHDLVEGGSGNDTVSGDAGDDTVMGGQGDDVVLGGEGTGYLRGGEGGDFVQGGSGFDDAHGNQGNDVVRGGGGDDWVVGGQDHDALFGDEGGDLVLGNLGNDSLEGGEGADIVRGGQGDDIVSGGAGDDWISGDRGSDVLTGGAGADVFHSFSGAGIDRVTDFSQADGDRVNLLAGSTYTVAQAGADVVVDLGGGDQLVLTGVQLTSLTSGWIIVG
jgi:Ca2+-binding RTX toxin-like protein